MTSSDDQPERPRLRRELRLLLGGLVIEAALVWIVQLSPAMRALMRPVYLIVAVAFGVAIWHAWRRRAHDRRHGDRRERHQTSK